MELQYNVSRRILLLLTIPTVIFAQTGSLPGVITDETTGQPLIGTNVIITSNFSGLGAAITFDGSYLISGIPAGRHDIKVTYIGYKVQDVFGIEIIENQTTRMDVTLAIESIQIKSVEVKAEVKK